MRRLCLPFLLAVLAPLGCPKPTAVPHPVEEEACEERIVELFGDQSTYVVAVRPLTSRPLFSPSMLDVMDRLTQRLEEAESDHLWGIRSVTSVPLIRPSGRGADLIRIRDELPVDADQAARYHPLIKAMEFTTGELINPGETAFFVHLPRANYTGVDMGSLMEELSVEFAEEVMLALDGTPESVHRVYREIAGRGPSADAVLVLYTHPERAEVKSPEFLAALYALQERLETLPGVAVTYGLTDDVMLTRRMVHRGDPSAATLPLKQAEVNQMLLLYQMSGTPEEFGSRISDDGMATILRVTLRALDEESRELVSTQIRQTAGEGFPAGVSDVACGP